MSSFTDPVDAVKAVLGMPRDLDYPELVHPEPRDDEPEALDHVKIAVDLLGASDDAEGEPLEQIAWCFAAQVHATLALVEAQNTANLIEWAGVSEIITPARRERIEKGLGL